MKVEFDPTKDAKNILKHKISLADAAEFEWEDARIEEDLRRPYPEQRFKATGEIGSRLHELVFCLRSGVVRVISLRKSNPREVKRYANPD